MGSAIACFHDDHHPPGLASRRHPGNLDIHDEAAIEGTTKTIPEPSRSNRRRRTRTRAQNSNDASFDRPSLTFDTGHHPITVHRLIQVAAGDENVALGILERAIGNDETGKRWMGSSPADDEVHAVRQPELAPARLDECACFYEFREQLERRPSGGQLQALKHLPRRCRVVQLVANQQEKLRSWVNIVSILGYLFLRFYFPTGVGGSVYRLCDRNRAFRRDRPGPVRLAQAGDVDAFRLVERNRRAVFRARWPASAPAEADDVPKAFVTAYRKLALSEANRSSAPGCCPSPGEKPSIAARAFPGGWYRGRCVADGHRRGRIRSNGTGPFVESIAGRDIVDEELQQNVTRLIGTLPKKLRDALLLAGTGEHTYEEISHMLGAPLGTVKWRVSEARRILGARLES